MKKLSQVLFVASAVLASSYSLAKSAIDYNYVGIQYFDQNLDDADCSQDGLSLNGSMELNSDFFVLGNYADASGDKWCGSKTLSAGVGYQTLFGADSSAYGTLSLEDTSVDYGDDDSGLVVAAGLRGFVKPQLEGKIEIAHHTAFDGNTVITGGGAYWFDPQFAATGEVSLGSDVSGIAIGLRVDF